MVAASILFVATDSKIVQTYRRLAEQVEIELSVVSSLGEAAKDMARRDYDAVLVQMDGAGRQVRKRIGEGLSFCGVAPAIATSSHATIRDAVDALRAGACEYVAEPPDDPRGLQALLHRAQCAATNGNGHAREGAPCGDGLLTGDTRVLAASETLARVAASEVPILICGEVGTGKTTLARALHQRSRRCLAPFVEFRCARDNEARMERELMGHVWDPAPAERRIIRGRLDQADGGTLVLDDVHCLPAALRARVLRAASDGRFERAGSDQACRCDVRLVLTAPPQRCSVDASLKHWLQGHNGVSVELPPLRDRVGDIPPLARRFLLSMAARHGRRAREFGAEAIACLVRYHWPGNVNELKNAVEHGVILCAGRHILARDLPANILEWCERSHKSPNGQCTNLKEALREPERRCIVNALEATDWNKQHAARELQISRSTLYKKLKEHGLNGRANSSTPS